MFNGSKYKNFLEEFLPSSDEVIEGMLKLAEVSKKDVVYDLGSGDASILIRAVQEPFNAKYAVGIEIQDYLVEESLENIRKFGLQNKVKIEKGDISGAYIGDASVVTLYQSPPANEELRPKLESELKKTARVVSNCFEFKNWKCSRERRIMTPFEGFEGKPLSIPIYLYRMDSI